MSHSLIPDDCIGAETILRARGSWPASVHVFDKLSVLAIRAALAAQRPLLIRGEPGTGKSQLARAAAEVLGRLFIAEVVHTRSESQDLQWRYDAVGRLGDAQALGAARLSHEEVRQRLEPLNYLSPGPLWWVFDWATALNQHEAGGRQYAAPKPPSERWGPSHGSVLLIDEIDKADADLPNGLLETLGNGAFTVPWRDQAVAAQAGIPTPLVVITTNEERELPAAFVRRCLVLNLEMPESETDFVAALVHRGTIHAKHFRDEHGAPRPQPAIHDEVFVEAARQLWADRQIARRDGVPPPGQAEYIDMLRAIAALEPALVQQMDLLAEIKDFALKKHPTPRG